MQGDIENVATRALEPGSEATELIMMLQQQHLVPIFRKIVRPSQSAQARTHDYDVVFIFDTFKPIFCHNV